VFERFTERARQVVVVAQDEARDLGHGYIGTEHLLLALLREQDGLGGRVLGALNVTTDQARALVEPSGESSPIKIPFTPRAKHSLDLALTEARSLGHSYIGTEHILLGIVGQDGGVAVEILSSLGVHAAAIRVQTLRLLGAASEAAVGSGLRGSWPAAENLPQALRRLRLNRS
jgi:ATP-dependent Clp protease ATP-binding subunit ClpC